MARRTCTRFHMTKFEYYRLEFLLPRIRRLSQKGPRPIGFLLISLWIVGLFLIILRYV